MDVQLFPTPLVFGVFGLLIGSFLNVVIYRLPKMMELQWRAECAEFSGTPIKEETSFNLVVPRSACPQCKHQISWKENIPLISYAFLRGKCSACGTRISARYPLVELTTGVFFAWCGNQWGMSFEAAMWCLFSAAVVALAAIDWDTTLLPDDITLPLMWIGLAGASLGLTGSGLTSAFWGAVAGYGSLWSVYWAFKLATGKEGMGYGDFKLFAALGAWFGWHALIPIILMASVFGAVVGIGMKLSSGLREGGYVPFGPFLALGGLTAMIVSPSEMLKFVGL